jgi:hypothetical protein
MCRQRAPISPDLDEISTLLWQRHFETNLKDSERAMAAREVLAPYSGPRGDENGDEDSTFDSVVSSSL